jgi:hypothetical protein
MPARCRRAGSSTTRHDERQLRGAHPVRLFDLVGRKAVAASGEIPVPLKDSLSVGLPPRGFPCSVLAHVLRVQAAAGAIAVRASGRQFPAVSGGFQRVSGQSLETAPKTPKPA